VTAPVALTETFGVSRPTLREAFRILEAASRELLRGGLDPQAVADLFG
jgi:hypothetical protein